LGDLLYANPIPKYVPEQQAYSNAKQGAGGIGPKISPFSASIHIRLDKLYGSTKSDDAR